MGSVGAGLASVGGSIAQAQELKRQEEFEKVKLAIQQAEAARANKQLDLSQQEFDFRKRQAAQPQVVYTYRATDGKVHNIVRDPVTSKFSDVTAGEAQEATAMTDKFAAFKGAFGRDPSEEEKKTLFGIEKPVAPKYGAEKQVRDPKSPTGWSWSITEEGSGKQTLIPGAPNPYVSRATSGGGGSSGSVQDLAENVRSGVDKITDIKQGPLRNAVATYMRKNNMKPASGDLRPLNTQEQQLLDSINTIEPTLGVLEQVIKDAKLENDNSPIAPRRDWIAYKYFQIAPSDPVRGEIIRNSAALQVMGAAPWIRIGRGKYLFETISNHLPKPEDSPKLLMDKVKFLRRVMEDSKKSLGVADESAPSGAAPGATDPAVEQYLKSIGVKP